MAGSQGAQKKKNQLQKTVQNVSQKSMLNAARGGFRGLQNGSALCPNKSSSPLAEDLKIDLAARQIEHCLESWNFLSQATWALMNGQDSQAIHMAYYAEIRAANSLLAATGIAEKERPAYYLAHTEVRKPLQVRTHQFIREVWPLWCQRSDAIEAYHKLKVIQSVSLADIGNALNLSHQNNSRHMLAWGYELIHFNKDHSSRNEASYRTSFIYEGIPELDRKDHGKIISLAWEHLLPAGIDGQMQFEVIYARYLIHRYCKDFAEQADVTEPKEEFSGRLELVLKNISSNTGVSIDTLRSVFDLELEEDPRFRLFELASSEDCSAENIFCRAVILARLSTSKLNDNINDTNCHNALAWIETWLSEAGIIGNGDTPADVASMADH